MFREVGNTVSIHTFYLQTSQDPSTGLVVMHCYTVLQHNLKKKKLKFRLVLWVCVHLKGISVSASALTEPRWDHISRHPLVFVTATAIVASLKIYNCLVLISHSPLQMWMDRINPLHFDGLHITGDKCGHYSRSQCSPWPPRDCSHPPDTRIGAITSFINRGRWKDHIHEVWGYRPLKHATLFRLNPWYSLVKTAV